MVTLGTDDTDTMQHVNVSVCAGVTKLHTYSVCFY